MWKYTICLPGAEPSALRYFAAVKSRDNRIWRLHCAGQHMAYRPILDSCASLAGRLLALSSKCPTMDSASSCEHSPSPCMGHSIDSLLLSEGGLAGWSPWGLEIPQYALQGWKVVVATTGTQSQRLLWCDDITNSAGFHGLPPSVGLGGQPTDISLLLHFTNFAVMLNWHTLWPAALLDGQRMYLLHRIHSSRPCLCEHGSRSAALH